MCVRFCFLYTLILPPPPPCVSSLTSLWAKLPELNHIENKGMKQAPKADNVQHCLAKRHIYTMATGEDDKIIKVCDYTCKLPHKIDCLAVGLCENDNLLSCYQWATSNNEYTHICLKVLHLYYY